MFPKVIFFLSSSSAEIIMVAGFLMIKCKDVSLIVFIASPYVVLDVLFATGAAHPAAVFSVREDGAADHSFSRQCRVSVSWAAGQGQTTRPRGRASIHMWALYELWRNNNDTFISLIKEIGLHWLWEGTWQFWVTGGKKCHEEADCETVDPGWSVSNGVHSHRHVLRGILLGLNNPLILDPDNGGNKKSSIFINVMSLKAKVDMDVYKNVTDSEVQFFWACFLMRPNFNHLTPSFRYPDKLCEKFPVFSGRSELPPAAGLLRSAHGTSSSQLHQRHLSMSVCEPKTLIMPRFQS